MSRLSCVETVESNDGCGCCTIATVELGWSARDQYILIYHGHRYKGIASATSTISQDDANYQAYILAKSEALRLAGIKAWITEDEFQLITEDEFSLTA